ncbi:MAG: hypothetical protein U1E88_04760 [Acinetobacter sp.]
MGYNNNASGDALMRWVIITSGWLSSAVGYGNKASGDASSAVGHVNTASAGASSAVGYGNKASGQSSSAVGYVNTASGTYSSAVSYVNRIRYFLMRWIIVITHQVILAVRWVLVAKQRHADNAFGIQNTVDHGLSNTDPFISDGVGRFTANAFGSVNHVTGVGATAVGLKILHQVWSVVHLVQVQLPIKKEQSPLLVGMTKMLIIKLVMQV